MKTRLAIFVFAFSFACGVEALDAEAPETESSNLVSAPPQPEVVRIPITIENPEANAGLDPSGDGYPGWKEDAWGLYYYETRIAYDATLNSNVFNITTYSPQSGAQGQYWMSQSFAYNDLSASARQAIDDGYPIECQAALNVSYDVQDDVHLQFRVVTGVGWNTIDFCDKFVTTENRWQTTTCGPIASVGMDWFGLGFYCKSSSYCKIDKVKCYVVKREGFERFKPLGAIKGLLGGQPQL